MLGYFLIMFRGWYTDKKCKNPYKPEAVTGEVHLFAKWIEESEELYSVAAAGVFVQLKKKNRNG